MSNRRIHRVGSLIRGPYRLHEVITESTGKYQGIYPIVPTYHSPDTSRRSLQWKTVSFSEQSRVNLHNEHMGIEERNTSINFAR